MSVSNYDEFEYDYSTYWKNRNYEHFAEVIALQKMLSDAKGKWFVDVGGSYGRHVPIYYEKFTNPIILDYSLNTLINNKDRIFEKYPNVSLIAANVYFLPFKEDVFDGGIMIRVLHHIEETPKYLSELKRVMKNDAIYIQEFANKMNIKAKMRNLLKRNWKYFNQDPYQQPSHQSCEGSQGIETTFLNFHPKYIIKLLKNSGFKVTKKLGVSFLRLPFLKKLVPMKILLSLEKIFQKLFGSTDFAPSIFLNCKVQKLGDTKYGNDLEKILACPKCKGELNFRKEECICSVCKNKYEKVAGIWDFRIQ